MNLNNKGMSLLELLVTIIMVGVVLIFIFQLLMDLKGERDTNNYAYDNQVNRAELIHTVEKDLNKYYLVGVRQIAGNNINIDFVYNRNNAEVTATLAVDEVREGNTTKNYVSYKSVSGETFYWEMKNAVIDPCGEFIYHFETDASGSTMFYFKLTMFVYNRIDHRKNNKESNNPMDDIEISYLNKLNDMFLKGVSSNRFNLTNTNNEPKNIGKCTN